MKNPQSHILSCHSLQHLARLIQLRLWTMTLVSPISLLHPFPTPSSSPIMPQPHRWKSFHPLIHLLRPRLQSIQRHSQWALLLSMPRSALASSAIPVTLPMVARTSDHPNLAPRKLSFKLPMRPTNSALASQPPTLPTLITMPLLIMLILPTVLTIQTTPIPGRSLNPTRPLETVPLDVGYEGSALPPTLRLGSSTMVVCCQLLLRLPEIPPRSTPSLQAPITSVLRISLPSLHSLICHPTPPDLGNTPMVLSSPHPRLLLHFLTPVRVPLGNHPRVSHTILTPKAPYVLALVLIISVRLLAPRQLYFRCPRVRLIWSTEVDLGERIVVILSKSLKPRLALTVLRKSDSWAKATSAGSTSFERNLPVWILSLMAHLVHLGSMPWKSWIKRKWSSAIRLSARWRNRCALLVMILFIVCSSSRLLWSFSLVNVSRVFFQAATTRSLSPCTTRFNPKITFTSVWNTVWEANLWARSSFCSVKKHFTISSRLIWLRFISFCEVSSSPNSTWQTISRRRSSVLCLRSHRGAWVSTSAWVHLSRPEARESVLFTPWLWYSLVPRL